MGAVYEALEPWVIEDENAILPLGPADELLHGRLPNGIT